MAKNQANELCEQSPNQLSPRQVKATDFSILESKDAIKVPVPFHGQCGDGGGLDPLV